MSHHRRGRYLSTGNKSSPLWITNRNFQPDSTVSKTTERSSAVQDLGPICTLGGPASCAPPLSGPLFLGWARRSRCGLSYSLLQILRDEAWDIWRVSVITHGERRAQSALVRICQGAYQIPITLGCDRAFVGDELGALFVNLTALYLKAEDVTGVKNPIRLSLDNWGQRLPNYSPTESTAIMRIREWDSFEWAMLIEGGLVITLEDWEVSKAFSSYSIVAGMSVHEILEKGLRFTPENHFPPTPYLVCGPGGIPAGSAFPTLWSLRFFAAHIYGGGSPSVMRRPSASVKHRFDEIVRDEIVLCVVLGVTAERDAFMRTPVLGRELIAKLEEYDGPGEIPTRHGTISIKSAAARLKRARLVPFKHYVQEHPAHVEAPLFYVPDELVPDEQPVNLVSRNLTEW